MLLGMYFLSDVSPIKTLTSLSQSPMNSIIFTGKMESLWKSRTKVWSKCFYLLQNYHVLWHELCLVHCDIEVKDDNFLSNNKIH